MNLPSQTDIAKGGVATPFPWRLHEMLEFVEKTEGLEHVVCWKPHGRAFAVLNKKIFVDMVMTRYVQEAWSIVGVYMVVTVMLDE
jgi:hypothetical protein